MRKVELLRILDANINRTREGLRVCEDIIRFLYNDKKIAFYFKKLRHEFNGILKKSPRFYKKELIKYRNIKSDVGKNLVLEKRKKNIFELLSANLQRVEESLRVLEEICKLLSYKEEEIFRRMRFKVYNIEKKVLMFVFQYAKKKNS